MLKSIKLHGVGPVRDLSASFGDRLNIVTGDNGLGKSFLLDVCFWSLTGTWPGGRIAIPDRTFKGPTISYSIQSKTRPASRQAKYDFKSQSWSRQRCRRTFPPRFWPQRIRPSSSHPSSRTSMMMRINSSASISIRTSLRARW